MDLGLGRQMAEKSGAAGSGPHRRRRAEAAVPLPEAASSIGTRYGARVYCCAAFASLEDVSRLKPKHRLLGHLFADDDLDDHLEGVLFSLFSRCETGSFSKARGALILVHEGQT